MDQEVCTACERGNALYGFGVARVHDPHTSLLVSDAVAKRRHPVCGLCADDLVSSDRDTILVSHLKDLDIHPAQHVRICIENP